MGVTSTGGQGSPSSDLEGHLCDCVVVFAFPGWKDELRSNRYHWMQRWARRVPVIMVQPDVEHRRPVWVEPAPGIAGGELLHLQECGTRPSTAVAVAQARAIAGRLDERGLARPLVWTYSPMLGLAATLTPAVARVHHATENYYLVPGLDQGFFWSLSLCARSADLVVAVSSGVASGLRRHEPGLGDSLVEVTNGCDFRQASLAVDPDPRVAELATHWRRVAIYAGNINGRVDVELVGRVARADRESLVLLIGPFGGLTATERALWQRVLSEPNVHHEDAMDPDRLPSVYRAVDVGIVPYRHLPNIVDDGFPLKVFEMAATGLPMVSTLMRPIVGLHSAIRVVSTREEFLAAMRETGRAMLGPAVSSSLIELARSNDYDEKFSEVMEHLRSRNVPVTPRTRYDVAGAIDQAHVGAPLLAPDEFDARPLTTQVAMRALSRAHDTIVPRIPPPVRLRIKDAAKRILP